MSTLEAPTVSESIHGRRIMDLNIKLLYWQGLWLEDPKPDLEFYLKYFHPRLAHLLLQHRSLRLALQLFRTIYPWSLLIIWFLQVLVQNPVAIYLNWGVNNFAVIENMYMFCINVIVLNAFATVFFHKKEFYYVFAEMEYLFLPSHLDNEEQKMLLSKMKEFSCKVTKFILLIFVSITSLMIFLFNAFVLLPNRRLFMSEWYPFDTVSSPMYEITLFARSFHMVLTLLSTNTLVLCAVSVFMTFITYFRVLTNKIENINDISKKRLRENKFVAPEQLRELTSLTGTQGGITQSTEAAGLRLRTGQHEDDMAGMKVTEIEVRPQLCSEYPATARGDTQRAGSSAIDVRRTDNISFFLSTLLNSVNVIHVDKASGELAGGTDTGINEREDDLLSITSMDTEGESADKFGAASLDGITAVESNMEVNLQLAQFVNLHERFLRIIKFYGSMLNLVFILQWLVNVLAFGGTVILLTKAESLGPLEITQIICSAEVMAILFFFNYLATVITDQAEAVGEAVYCCDWLEASPSFKQSMLIIMSRTNQPLMIKPTGLDPLSLNNFAQVSNIAYKMLASLDSITK